MDKQGEYEKVIIFLISSLFYSIEMQTKKHIQLKSQFRIFGDISWILP